jgi:hypothetical protein
MHGAGAVAVEAEGLRGQWTQVGPLLGKHGGDLALGRAPPASRLNFPTPDHFASHTASENRGGLIRAKAHLPGRLQ